MIVHHDGCFGCGQANLFGLQLESDGVRGRFFVKQDHQGAPGYAHGGVMAAALDEAMALALHAEGLDVRTRRLEVDFRAPTPVGAFVDVEARIDGTRARATARCEGTVVAEAVGDFAVS